MLILIGVIGWKVGGIDQVNGLVRQIVDRVQPQSSANIQ